MSWMFLVRLIQWVDECDESYDRVLWINEYGDSNELVDYS